MINSDTIDEYNTLNDSKKMIVLLGLTESKYGMYIDTRIKEMETIINQFKPKRAKKHKRKNRKRRRGRK